MPAKQWEFRVSEERLPNLRSETSIEEIASDIVSHISSGSALCCHPDPFRSFTVKEGEQYRRVIYCVTIERPLFDRFFNSQHGYRGAYFRDPFDGLRANHTLLSAVAGALIGSPATRDCGEKQTFVRESIASLSAKAWLAEKDKEELCHNCKGEWSGETAKPGEIRNGRWEEAPAFSRWGTAAPYFTKIKFFGAFLRESAAMIDGFEEVVPALKRRRAQEIHDSGWS